MNREAQSVVVILLGGALLRISLTDAHLRYVKSGMQPWLVAAGAGIVALGLWTVLVEGFLHPAGAVAPVSSDGTDGVGPGGHGCPRVAWLLLLPVLGVFLVAPPALGAYAATRGGARHPPPVSDTHSRALPPGNPVTTTLTDYVARAVWEKGRTLSGRRVALTGFVIPGKDGAAYLSRMVISCCAADSYPVTVRITGMPPPSPRTADVWVRVTGSYRPAVGDTDLAVLAADSVTVVAAPRDAYES